MTLAIDLADASPRVRLYVEADIGVSEIVLTHDQTHYLTRVMRLGVNEFVSLFNGRDGEWLARITGAGKRAATVTPTKRRRPQAVGPDLTLVFAPLKRQPLDLLVRHATELGVRRFQPIMTQRTVAERVNLDRLKSIAIEAAEQCERLDVPTINSPARLDAVVAAWPADRPLLLCDETGAGAPIATALAGVGAGAAGIVCGPEGGFAATELDALRQLHFVIPVVLGPRILRAETAALAALSVWQAVRGDGAEKPPLRAGAGRDSHLQE